jgi:glucan endo-1,3-alpha-glucosidase
MFFQFVLFLFLNAVTVSAQKPVFAHYMVGGMEASNAVDDIQGGLDLGIDAFALNMGSWTAGWSIDSVNKIFNAAQGTNMKLFFSIDTAQATDPTEWVTGIKNWTSHPNYYTYEGKPFISTFSGATMTFGSSDPNDGWKSNVIDPLANAGIEVYFVPNFDNAANYPNDFYSTFSIANGAFGWETAWPEISAGHVNVSDAIDKQMISSRPDGKTYMMSLSTLQFKHIDSSQNWMRIGESTLPIRMKQILEDQPDMVEIITWNDAGESH